MMLRLALVPSWLAGMLVAGGVVEPMRSQTSSASAPRAVLSASDPVVAHERSEFTGLWDYNAAESVNIQTGQPEQAPRGATARARGAAPTAPPASTATPAPGGRGGRGGTGGSGGGGVATPEMMRETQDLARDLLEVPEALTIAITPAAMVITDDLGRTRTYPTDGTKQKYRLGAAEFDARMEFRDSQFLKSIEGIYGFRMTETYFLSPDASRLFVMIRVGQPRQNAPQTGFNRVYDRIER